MYTSSLYALLPFLTTINKASSYQPYPFDPYNETYVAQLRTVLDSFHENLSRGKVNENAMMNAADIFWNYDGEFFLNNTEFGRALGGRVEAAFKGVYIPDVYEIVDGNICATLWDLQGNQTGPILDQPVTPGAKFNIRGSELWVFDEDLKVNELTTTSEIGRLREQVAGRAPVPASTPNGTQPIPAGESTKEYKDKTRASMAALHKNANKLDFAANEALATENVIVDIEGRIETGRHAFAKVTAADNQGLGAFSFKQFHDFYVIADGRQGMIEYSWIGNQDGDYNGAPADQKKVRVRAALYFEFNEDGLAEKVISVHDERVIADYVSGNFKYLYP